MHFLIVQHWSLDELEKAVNLALSNIEKDKLFSVSGITLVPSHGIHLYLITIVYS